MIDKSKFKMFIFRLSKVERELAQWLQEKTPLDVSITTAYRMPAILE